jgi:hypothetical protein
MDDGGAHSARVEALKGAERTPLVASALAAVWALAPPAFGLAGFWACRVRLGRPGAKRLAGQLVRRLVPDREVRTGRGLTGSSNGRAPERTSDQLFYAESRHEPLRPRRWPGRRRRPRPRTGGAGSDPPSAVSSTCSSSLIHRPTLPGAKCRARRLGSRLAEAPVRILEHAPSPGVAGAVQNRLGRRCRPTDPGVALGSARGRRALRIES